VGDHLSTPLDPSTTQTIRTALRRTITRLGLRGNAARQ
jgi:TetR/AcrR family transcriptional regulator, regulator of biofilm formation and stress response